MKPSKTTALIGALSLSACASNLTPEQREARVQAFTAGAYAVAGMANAAAAGMQLAQPQPRVFTPAPIVVNRPVIYPIRPIAPIVRYRPMIMPVRP